MLSREILNLRSKSLNPLVIVLTVSILLLSRETTAQFYQSTSYKGNSGLPSSESYMVFQDRKGFVWIATDNGVVKYDGHEFVTYNTTNGLVDNTVFGFYEDNKGRIWFRTYSNQLSYYENDTIKNYPYNKQLQEFVNRALVHNIYYDSTGNLYFSTIIMSQIAKIDAFGKLTVLVKHEENQNVINYFDGILMVSTSGVPSMIRSVNILGKEFPVGLDNYEKQGQQIINVVRWRGKMYFTIHHNIFVYDGEHVRKVFTSGHPFISLYVDHEDRLWAGYFNNGVSIFEDDLLTKPRSLITVEGLSVSGVMQDYEDGIWVSTLDQGVFYFPNLTVQNYDPPSNIRISAVANAGNDIYLGNYGGEVYKMNDKGIMKKVDQGLAPVTYLFLDSQKTLWISDGGGAHLLGVQENIDRAELGAMGVKTVHELKDIVIASNSIGIFKLTKKGKVIESIRNLQRVSSLAVAGDKIFVGGVNGLDQYNIDFKVPVKRLMETRVISLAAVGDRFLIIGTAGHGFLTYDTVTGRFSSIAVPQVLKIYSIVTDWPNRRLWAGTDRGLYQLEFLKDTADIVFDDFTKAEGLTSNKINMVSRVNDNIWAFSDLGISSVPIGHFMEHKFPPRFYINRILFKNGSLPANPTSVRITEGDMVIDVRPITFKGQSTFFRYRLGPASPWKLVSDGSVFISDLRPGNYEMELQASSDDENWTDGTTLKIDVIAKWWETWTFRIGVVIAILLLGYLAYWLRMSALRRRQKYLELINLHQQKLIDSEIRTQERERKRIATDLHDGIGATLSSIKLQVASSMNDDSEQAPDRAKEINDNLADVIDDIKRIVYDLHPPGLERYGLHSGLKSLVDRLNKTSDVNVIFDYYGQRDIVQSVSITIYRILQELINNTLKHARASEIRIHINEFEDEINIMYEDNGIGMIGSRFTGLGLHSIESRVRSLNGRMTWESNHKGTFYNFDIPF